MKLARVHALPEEGGSHIARMKSARGKTTTFETLSPTVYKIADMNWDSAVFAELTKLDSVAWNLSITSVVQDADVTIYFEGNVISGSSKCNSCTGLG